MEICKIFKRDPIIFVKLKALFRTQSWQKSRFGMHSSGCFPLRVVWKTKTFVNRPFLCSNSLTDNKGSLGIFVQISPIIITFSRLFTCFQTFELAIEPNRRLNILKTLTIRSKFCSMDFFDESLDTLTADQILLCLCSVFSFLSHFTPKFHVVFHVLGENRVSPKCRISAFADVHKKWRCNIESRLTSTE